MTAPSKVHYTTRPTAPGRRVRALCGQSVRAESIASLFSALTCATCRARFTAPCNAQQIVDHLLADAGGDTAQAWRVLAGWLEDQIIVGVPPHLRRILGAVREEIARRSNPRNTAMKLSIASIFLATTLTLGCDVGPLPPDSSTGDASSTGDLSTSTGSTGEPTEASSSSSEGDTSSSGSSSSSSSSSGGAPTCAGDPCESECGPGLACVDRLCVVPCEVVEDCPVGSDTCGPLIGTPITHACLAGGELVGGCG